MLVAALRDLRWRRKRFIITVLGTALVFSMGLLMSGLSNAFTVEVDRTLRQSGADRWIAPSAAAGPFSAGINVPLDDSNQTGVIDGVERADPVLYTRAVAMVDGQPVDVNLFGIVPAGLGAPPASRGRGPVRSGEAMVARRFANIGDRFAMFGRSFEVVGTVGKASLIGGSSSVFVELGDAQALVVQGEHVASMILTKGVPTGLPEVLEAFDMDQAKVDLARPLKNATRSIDFVRILLWLVAGLIVASVVYLSALERTRDFAVFKATGVSTGAIGAGLAVQAVVIAVAASLVGGVLATAIAPTFPMDVVISTGSLLFLPVLAVLVGLVASLVGMRRIAEVPRAAAFCGP
jgi:putative ABC transport system permease protein